MHWPASKSINGISVWKGLNLHRRLGAYVFLLNRADPEVWPIEAYHSVKCLLKCIIICRSIV